MEDDFEECFLLLSFLCLFVLSGCSENRQKGGQTKKRNKRTRKKGKKILVIFGVLTPGTLVF